MQTVGFSAGTVLIILEPEMADAATSTWCLRWAPHLWVFT
jgi:hypothetical protein